MHASFLENANFQISIDEEQSSFSDLFPQWTHYDRIGVVVHEPYGGLGASLLTQAGISHFYNSCPARKSENPQYPPVFLFHVGGRHGDHSEMDFWPPRREVFLPNDPYAVLGAIRDRAITRLIVPDVPDSGIDYVYPHPSGWTDLHSAEEQTLSNYLYSPDGKVSDSNIELRATDPKVEGFVRDVLDYEELLSWYESATEEDLLKVKLGPSTPSDYRGWLEKFKRRIDEVPAEIRKRVLTARKTDFPDQLPVQTYRSISTVEALGRLIPDGS